MICKNVISDFQREIIQYCRKDVDILRRACMAFRKIFLERGNVQGSHEYHVWKFQMYKRFSQKLFMQERNRYHSIGPIQW